MSAPEPPFIPYFEGPRPPATTARRFGRRGAALVTGLAVAGVLGMGAAVLVAHPWGGADGPGPLVLHHGTVEGGLFDDGTPHCNGGADIPAVSGRRFVCTSDTKVYVVRVEGVDSADRRVGWEVVSERYR